MGGIQAALILALRIARDRNVQWPLTLMAVLSAVLLAAGVLRHYWDIYVHRTVRGISFLFVGIDAAGDLFSLVSIVFQARLDVLGTVIYGTELMLWIGVFACGGYYNLLPWVTKKLNRRKVGVQDTAANPGPTLSSVGGGGTPVALHSLPSSTSVFRTPSAEVESLRQRNTATGGSEWNDCNGA
ncbi:unnamed protein product [Periconia digitata]|uniref:PQ loop repeat protein n=1 Tax=Periconia digitata TaxID=1303443 RepID=A0A9W4UEQ9_9PLEO|nr:unnamed protein product [Periconia digitata]